MKSTLHRCQSCHCSLEEDSNYCDTCGQKRIDQLPSMKELLRDFFSNIWALDSKLLRTIGTLLLQPGQLTLAYLKGTRNRYYTPFKLFLFWLTISFLLINSLIQQSEEFQQLDAYDFELNAYKTISQKGLHAHFQDSLDRIVIDSILLQGLPENKTYDEGVFSIMDKEFSIEELEAHSVEELIQRKNITHPIERQIAIQLLKAYKDPGKFQTYIISHLSWLFLSSLPLLALWMYLLYWRKHPYYIQHFVFLLHIHTFVLVLTTILAFALWIHPVIMASILLLRNILVTLSLGYSFGALKVVYKQSWRKTLLKFILLFFGYMIVFIITMLLFVFINFLLF
ncbi:MAG: DUF3667 domain-containing protein [Aureispira sp.]